MQKKCSHCKILRDLSEFHKRWNGKDGLNAECKWCFQKRYKEFPPERKLRLRTKAREWQKRNPERVAAKARKCWLKNKYGLTLQQYADMLKAQNYCCAICFIPEEELVKGLAVDHDHSSGKIRGLLCGGCNTAIGRFRDDTIILARAIRYINRYALPSK